MTFKHFSTVNRQRCESARGFNRQLTSWRIWEWTNAVAGEAGEACNNAKKALREAQGIPGNTLPVNHREIASELCDVIIYCDLAIQSLGYDTETLLKIVFNVKSDKIGSLDKL